MNQTHSYQTQVNLEDIDFMGHVGNHIWLNYLLRARIDFLEKIGLPYAEFAKQKMAAVVARAEIDYLFPGFFGDTLSISMRIEPATDKSIWLRYEVTNQKERACLKAALHMVFINAEGRSTAIPEPIGKLLL